MNRAGRYIEYTRCIAACSLWDVENDYIVNIRVYIQLSRSCLSSQVAAAGAG